MSDTLDLDERFRRIVRQVLERLRPTAPWLFPHSLAFRFALPKAEWLALLNAETLRARLSNSSDLTPTWALVEDDRVTIGWSFGRGSYPKFSGRLADEGDHTSIIGQVSLPRPVIAQNLLAIIGYPLLSVWALLIWFIPSEAYRYGTTKDVIAGIFIISVFPFVSFFYMRMLNIDWERRTRACLKLFSEHLRGQSILNVIDRGRRPVGSL